MKTIACSLCLALAFMGAPATFGADTPADDQTQVQPDPAIDVETSVGVEGHAVIAVPRGGKIGAVETGHCMKCLGSQKADEVEGDDGTPLDLWVVQFEPVEVGTCTIKIEVQDATGKLIEIVVANVTVTAAPVDGQ